MKGTDLFLHWDTITQVFFSRPPIGAHKPIFGSHIVAQDIGLTQRQHPLCQIQIKTEEPVTRNCFLLISIRSPGSLPYPCLQTAMYSTWPLTKQLGFTVVRAQG